MEIQNNKNRLSMFFVVLLILLIIGLIATFIWCAIEENTSKNTIETASTNTISTTNTTNTANTNKTTDNEGTTTKEYYDFIDAENGTFDFTEDELIKRVCKGASYTSVGYRKSASTNDRDTNLYAYMTPQGVETISVTTSAQNYKVREFRFSFVSSNLTQELAQQLIDAYALQGFAIINGGTSGTVSESEDKVLAEIVHELEQVGNKLKGKGLVYTFEKTTRSITVIFSVEL